MSSADVHRLPAAIFGRASRIDPVRFDSPDALAAVAFAKPRRVGEARLPEATGPVLPAFCEHAWEPFGLTDPISTAIATVPDRVGSLDLIQPTVANQGTLQTDGTNRYIAMDATNDEYYTATSVDWTAGFSWFAVMRTESLFNYRNYCGLGVSGGPEKSVLFSSWLGSVTLQRRTPSFLTCASANGTISAGVNNIITADSSLSQVWLNRVSVATAAPITPPSADVFAVGRPYNIVSGGRLNGRFYALYKCPPGLSTAQREEMWDYIEARLAGSL